MFDCDLFEFFLLCEGSSCISSHLDTLNFVVNLEVELVVVSNELVFAEWECGLFPVGVLVGDLGVKICPLAVKVRSLVLILLDSEYFAVCWLHFEGFLEGIRIDLLQDSLQSNQTLLENLVPVILSEIVDDWDEHGESLLLVGLKDVQEVVILEEAHGSISYLQVISANWLDNSLEQLGDQIYDLVDFAHLEHLLQLGQEESLLDTVGEGPVSEETLEEWDGQGTILSQEEHGASEELLIELRACLHLVEWDDNRLEEDHVLVSQWHCESWDNTGKDIQELSSSIELVSLMNESEEAFVHGLSDHLSSWHQL